MSGGGCFRPGRTADSRINKGSEGAGEAAEVAIGSSKNEEEE